MTSDGNLFGAIDAVARRDPSKPLLVLGNDTKLTYGDMLARTAQLANVLTAEGVRSGDRVAVQVEKSAEALFLYLACVRAGAVFLPLNTAYTERELDHFFSDAEPALIVCDPKRRDTVAERSSIGSAKLETLDSEGRGSFASKADEASSTFPAVHRAPDDLASLIYTSGTTGRSKGAMLTHQAILSNALSLRKIWGFTETDVLLHMLPIYHVHGLFVASNTVMLAGGQMMFLPKFDAELACRLLPRATSMMGVPTYYTRLLDCPAFTRDIAGPIRLFVSGSAPLLSETFRQFEEVTGHRILERYGMTETGMNTSNPLNGPRKPGTVGVPLPDVEIRVCDEQGNVVAQVEPGVVEVRGPNVFQGYWRLPQKTQEEFREDGFFITGDIGRIDGDGYLEIVGRAKDLIISGGLNIYPKEIETVIDGMPGVQESAVIGVPHPDFGEAVVAVIATQQDLDKETIKAALKTHLAGFKQPKAIEFVSELPKNAMGKVRKNVLRGRFSGLL